MVKVSQVRQRLPEMRVGDHDPLRDAGLLAIQPDVNDITKHVMNVFWDVKPTELPLRPEAVALTVCMENQKFTDLVPK